MPTTDDPKPTTDYCSSRTCKPNSVCREVPLAGTTYRRTAIPLGRSSLSSSSDLPGGLARRAGTRPAEAELPPYLVLLRVGFALPDALLRQRCALTAPFHPYPAVVTNPCLMLKDA